jgi:hypothetical protein
VTHAHLIAGHPGDVAIDPAGRGCLGELAESGRFPALGSTPGAFVVLYRCAECGSLLPCEEGPEPHTWRLKDSYSPGPGFLGVLAARTLPARGER